MESAWKDAVWQQFGAAMDMMKNAIEACPEKIWGDQSGFHEFWYMTYHTLFWLDFYLSETPEGFSPPEPYTMGETDPAGVFPDRVYTKDEMLAYLSHCRIKCRNKIESLTNERIGQPSGFMDGKLAVLELHLYNMRHVQHHTAQLNLLLRQKINDAPRWVGKARD